MEEAKNLHILKKMHDIMSDVNYIQKDARNDHNKYNYASERAIKERLHAAFVKYGIVFLLDTRDVKSINDKILTVECGYIFFDVSSGESISGRFVGSGQCRDEKGVYAAVTGAIKYILTSTFLIPTGDDPEKDEDNKKPADKPKPADKTAEKLWKQIESTFGPLCPKRGTEGATAFVKWLVEHFKQPDYELLRVRLLAVKTTESGRLIKAFLNQ